MSEIAEITESTFHSLSMWETIQLFHEKFGHQFPETPDFLSAEADQFRTNFMIEELEEYIHAQTLEDKVDALVDLVVVAMGTAYMHGFEWPHHWNEVYSANMRKERATNPDQSKRGTSLDIIKPEGWTGPDHSKILNGK